MTLECSIKEPPRAAEEERMTDPQLLAIITAIVFKGRNTEYPLSFDQVLATSIREAKQIMMAVKES